MNEHETRDAMKAAGYTPNAIEYICRAVAAGRVAVSRPKGATLVFKDLAPPKASKSATSKKSGK